MAKGGNPTKYGKGMCPPMRKPSAGGSTKTAKGMGGRKK